MAVQPQEAHHEIADVLQAISMTEEVYKQKKAAIDSLCDSMKGNTPEEAIEIMRKGWMEELEKEVEEERYRSTKNTPDSSS